MSYNLILTIDAQEEETEAYNYYEGIQTGLGEDLLVALEKSYNKIVENPLYYSFIVSSNILRDVKIDRFPYLVIYLVFGNNVTVVSIRSSFRRQFI